MAFSTAPDLSIINTVLPGFPKISLAPSSDAIKSRVPEIKNTTAEETIKQIAKTKKEFQKEREIRYKAIDTRTGNIFLIANPAAWEFHIDDHAREFKVRPAAVLEMTYAQAKKAAEEKPFDAAKGAKRSKNLFTEDY